MTQDDRSERVGIVMITRNRREEAAANTDRLCGLPERPRVVVVDNGSADGTSAVLRAREDVLVLALPFNAGAAARTLGAAMLDTPYVAFADDDSWWEPGALARAADVLDRHPDVAVVNAAILVGARGNPDSGPADAPGHARGGPGPERLDPICEEMAASPLGDGSGPGTELVSFMAGASVLRRVAYFRLGGFEPRLLIGGEEELLAADLLAAGWRIVYVPEVVAHHHASTARDPHGRRWQGIRNTLWTTWLRRPLRRATIRTARLARVVPKDRVSLSAFAAAAGGAGWVAAERRPLPPTAERKIRLVERTQLASKARRYVS